MKDKDIVTIKVTVPKSKVKRIKALFEKEGVTVKIVSPQLPNGMRKGNYKKGEIPSQFAAAWADREEEINADDVRKKAWDNRGA